MNNDHFLYWGDIVKTNEDGVDFHIQVGTAQHQKDIPNKISINLDENASVSM